MQGQKKLTTLPWPKPQMGSADTPHFEVITKYHIQDKEKFLEVCFYSNKNRRPNYNCPASFRVFLSKKQKSFTVQLISGEVNNKSLYFNIRGLNYYTSPSTCFPWINPEDESRLKKFLNVKETENHCMVELDNWMENRIEEQRTLRRSNQNGIKDEEVSLCADELPDWLEQQVRHQVLGKDNIIIYKKGNVRGLCYQCGQQIRMPWDQRLRQGNRAKCPNCGSECWAYLEDSNCFSATYVQNFAFLQRGTDGKTVFIRQFHVLRDPTAQWNEIRPFLEEFGRFAIRGDKTALWLNEGKESHFIGCSERYKRNGWERSTKLFIYDGRYEWLNEGTAGVLAGTRLQYSCWEEYLGTARNPNIIMYLLHFARYPCMEYLWKAGFRGLVQEKTRGLSKEDAYTISWQTKELKKVFHFPMHYIKIMPPEKWTMHDIKQTEEWLKKKAFTPIELKMLLDIKADPKMIGDILRHMTVTKMESYIKKIEPEPKEQRNATVNYRDYLQECEKLKLDLRDKSVLFPKDFEAAHMRTSAMVEYEEHPEEAIKFTQQVQKLERYKFSFGGWLIRPAESATELKFEGQRLHHCVAGYAKRMGEGTTAIFLIRRVEEPDKPFYTLELINGKINQCYGSHDKVAIEDKDQLEAFKAEWMKTVAQEKKKKKKAPAQVPMAEAV